MQKLFLFLIPLLLGEVKKTNFGRKAKKLLIILGVMFVSTCVLAVVGLVTLVTAITK